MVHTRYGRYKSKIIFFQLCYLIRVEHEKCSEMCVWIVGFGQILRKLGLFLVEKVDISKSDYMSLTPFLLTPCLSVKREFARNSPIKKIEVFGSA